MATLASQVRKLSGQGLSMIEVTSTCLRRGVQPLQQRYHPLWQFNGENDSTRSVITTFDNQKDLAVVLASLYDGDEQAFAKMKMRDRFHSDAPIPLVRTTLLLSCIRTLDTRPNPYLFI